MEEQITSLPESVKLPFEANAHGITPYFKIINPLNVAQSEEQGKPVYDAPMEVVELRFAGDRNYAPVLPANSMYRKHGTRVISYIERFADQYRAFTMGDNQVAGGTALEALGDYGITPAQLSVCRALKIYSIEALNELDGPNLKALGMNANDLKAMAKRYMDEKTARASASAASDIAAMQAEIERLKALVPAEAPAPNEVEEIVQAADEEAKDVEEKKALKDRIEQITGTRPRGNPSVKTLHEMLSEVEG